MIKPRPLLPAVEGGFTVDDFTVDEQAGTVTCPAGDHPAASPPSTPSSSGPPAAAARCAQRCTTSKAGRTLHLHQHDGLLRAARADWAAGPGLREDYMAHRPHVERVIAQVATWRGRRLKLRYRGSDQEPRLAQAPHRRAEPAQPARPRPGPPRRRLGPGHLTSRHRTAPGQEPPAGRGGRCSPPRTARSQVRQLTGQPSRHEGLKDPARRPPRNRPNSAGS